MAKRRIRTPLIPDTPEAAAHLERKHFFTWSSVQNLVGFAAMLVTLTAFIFNIKSDVRLHTQQLERIENAQKALWESVRGIRDKPR